MPWNYIAYGFRTDCNNLLDKYSKSADLSYSTFAEVWRNMKFSYIYFGRRSFSELLEFTEEVFKVCKEFMFPTFSLPFRLGSIFLMYGLYIKQPTREEIKIRMTLKEWDMLMQIWGMSQTNYLEDVNIIIARLCCLEAFHFSFIERQVGLEKKYRKYYEKGIRSTGESIIQINTPFLCDYKLIDEADNIFQNYRSAKEKLLLPEEIENDFLTFVNNNCMKMLKEDIIKLQDNNNSPELLSSNGEVQCKSGENFSCDTDEIPWWQCKKKMPWWRCCSFNGLQGNRLRRNQIVDCNEQLDDEENTNHRGKKETTHNVKHSSEKMYNNHEDELIRKNINIKGSLQSKKGNSQEVECTYNKKVMHTGLADTNIQMEMNTNEIKAGHQSKKRNSKKGNRTYNKKIMLTTHEDGSTIMEINTNEIRNAGQQGKNKNAQTVKRAYNKKTMPTKLEDTSIQKENNTDRIRNTGQQRKNDNALKVKRIYNKEIMHTKLEDTLIQKENNTNGIKNSFHPVENINSQKVKRPYIKKRMHTKLEDTLIQKENNTNGIKNSFHPVENVNSQKVKRPYNKKRMHTKLEDTSIQKEINTNESQQSKNEIARIVKRTYNKKIMDAKCEETSIKKEITTNEIRNAGQQGKNENTHKVKRAYNKKRMLNQVEDTSIQKENNTNGIKNSFHPVENVNSQKVKRPYNKKRMHTKLEDTSIQKEINTNGIRNSGQQVKSENAQIVKRTYNKKIINNKFEGTPIQKEIGKMEGIQNHVRKRARLAYLNNESCIKIHKKWNKSPSNDIQLEFETICAEENVYLNDSDHVNKKIKQSHTCKPDTKLPSHRIKLRQKKKNNSAKWDIKKYNSMRAAHIGRVYNLRTPSTL